MTGFKTPSDSDRDEDPHLSVTDSLYLLKGRYCQKQTGHIGLEFQEGPGPAFFALVSRSETIYLLACLASHTYVQYPAAEKKKLAKLLHLEEVAFPTYFIFVVHGYLQYGGCDWLGSHSLPCLTYLLLSSYILRGPVALADGTSLTVVKSWQLIQG